MLSATRSPTFSVVFKTRRTRSTSEIQECSTRSLLGAVRAPAGCSCLSSQDCGSSARSRVWIPSKKPPLNRSVLISFKTCDDLCISSSERRHRQTAPESGFSELILRARRPDGFGGCPLERSARLPGSNFPPEASAGERRTEAHLGRISAAAPSGTSGRPCSRRERR